MHERPAPHFGRWGARRSDKNMAALLADRLNLEAQGSTLETKGSALESYPNSSPNSSGYGGNSSETSPNSWENCPQNSAHSGGDGGHLDLYRVTHRNGEKEEDSCPNPIRFVVAEWDEASGEHYGNELVERPCMRKACPHCGPKLRKRYVAHYAGEFVELAERFPLYFATLTVDRKVKDEDGEPLSPEDSRKYLVHCWDKMLKRLRRRSEEIWYAGAFERHQDGYWHLHLVIGADYTAVDPTDARAVEEMMRTQWIGAKGGAVMDVKRIRPNSAHSDGRDTDGRPQTVAGAVGYVVKYALKDATEADEDGISRRSLIASQGIGYHSAEAKAERRAHATAANSAHSGNSGTIQEWQPMQVGQRSEFADSLTPDDRERFERMDDSQRTLTYRQKVDNSPEFGGRTVWKVYEHDPEGDVTRWTVYDRWPDAEGVQVLAEYDPTSGNSAGSGSRSGGDG